MLASDTDLIPVSKAGQFIPSRPSRATVWRWVLKGIRGHRIETVFVGSRRYVTREAIAAWLAAINSQDQPPPRVSSDQRERQAKNALDVLTNRRLT
jgi:hypothetical protein